MDKKSKIGGQNCNGRFSVSLNWIQTEGTPERTGLKERERGGGIASGILSASFHGCVREAFGKTT